MASLGACFKESHAELFGESLPLLCGDNFLLLTVSFITYEYFFNIWTGMKLNLTYPVPHVIKAVFLCAIVCKNNAHSPFVVGLGDSSEPFLACCVPYLKLHILAINLDRFNFEVNSYKEILYIILEIRFILEC